jgi:hypothetical protein
LLIRGLDLSKVDPKNFEFAFSVLESGLGTFVSPFSGKEILSFDSLFPFSSICFYPREGLKDKTCRILETGRGDEFTSGLFLARDPGYITRIRNLSKTPGELPVLYGVQFNDGEEIWLCKEPGEVEKVYSTRK